MKYILLLDKESKLYIVFGLHEKQVKEIYSFKWGKEYTDEEYKLALNKFNDITGSFNCSGCLECYECINCNECYNCIRCKNCKNCNRCVNCVDCTMCIRCEDCEFVSNTFSEKDLIYQDGNDD